MGSLLCAAPVLLVGLTACLPEGGYDKVVAREQRELPAHAFPEPPRVIAGVGQGGAGAQLVATNLPAGVTQEMVDEGQQLYGTVCVACHGPGGTGSPAGPQLTDGQWLNISGSFEEIGGVIANGVPNPKQYPGVMPPRGGGNFDEAQIRALAAYVYALSHQGGGA
ncbi:MAG TPA: cytochrome c [Longimicrobiaceae bacterium]|nr:cytochrome c [Longimicrobiaceae bacterium]